MPHALFPLLLAMALLTACRQPLTVASATTDTLRVERLRVDSVDRWHTRTILRTGDTLVVADTLVVQRFRTLYRDSVRTVRDTIRIAQPVPARQPRHTDLWLILLIALASLALYLIIKTAKP